MKPSERLAKITLHFLKYALDGLKIEWYQGVQHGGATINHDCLVVGRWSVAVLENGRLSLYTAEPKPGDYPPGYDTDADPLELVLGSSDADLDTIMLVLRMAHADRGPFGDKRGSPTTPPRRDDNAEH